MPAAGLLCNAGQPVRVDVGWGKDSRDSQTQEECAVVHLPKLMPGASTLAQLAAEAQGVTLALFRVDGPAFEVDQCMHDYSLESWKP